MSSDSAVTYTSVHSEARSWSIPSEDPYKEAARQLLEQAPRPSKYVPDPMELEDHVPVYIPEPEHPEDLVPVEDEAPIVPYITKSSHDLEESYNTIHISAAAATRQPGSTMARRVDHSFVDTMDTRVRDTERRTMAAVEVVNLRDAVRAEIKILRRERLAYEQESIETRQALARSEAYSRALEARIRVLETQAYRHEWQRQDADDHAIEHIMRTQTLEAGARDDTGNSA
ncbi:hypothetical protein Tco_1123731 [Tanacetum coccineum]|uniref:Uncharacterized protein n=1 Tax=Tanacetum coccineum TaxID=301880 RepID=A0ABQ5J462_9ASTR